MTYTIEVVSLGADLYDQLDDVLKWLSLLQPEFRFEFPPMRLRGALLTASDDADVIDLATEDVWTALRSYRETAKGDRRYLVAITASTLSSAKRRKLFGSTNAAEGLAVVSLSEQARYTSSFKAYVAYYLTRYALGFVVPQLRNHTDTRSCLFDGKDYKPDLRLSLRSGRLCDACLPVVRQAFNDEIERAIDLLTRAIRDAELGTIATPGSHTLQVSQPRDIDLLVVTALTEEAQIVAAVLGLVATEQRIDQQLTLYEYTCPSGRKMQIAAASAHAMGAVNMGVFTSPLLQELRPRSATLVGIAAAINQGAVRLGDVPFSSHVLSYDDIAVQNGSMTFRSEGYQVDPAMLRAAGVLRTSHRSYGPWQHECQRLLKPTIDEVNRLRVHPIQLPATHDLPHLIVDVTAGGPFLLRDSDFADTLRGTRTALTPDTPRISINGPLHPKLVSAEMESHGFMRSAHEHGVPATVIKGISDNGDQEKPKQEKETGGYYRALACCNALLAALHIRHLVNPPPRSR